jgi:hypothetical protein
MIKSLVQSSLFVAVGTVIGCSGAARSPEQYREDTAALLETQNGAVKQCYDDILRKDSQVSGKVAIKFTVKEETGQLADPAVDSAATTAPAPLAECVLQAISSLKLHPPDANEGHATFVYEFHVNPPLPSGSPAAGAPATLPPT